MESKKLIEKFYLSFQTRDAENMVACYHPDATFSDPIFDTLNANDTKNMWRMLINRGKDLNIQFAILKFSEKNVTATWIATYTFSLTGKKITNEIQAEFEIKDGLIFKHTDSFNLTRWLYQAFGIKGFIIAFIPKMKYMFKKRVKESLDHFTAKNQSV